MGWRCRLLYRSRAAESYRDTRFDIWKVLDLCPKNQYRFVSWFKWSSMQGLTWNVKILANIFHSCSTLETSNLIALDFPGFFQRARRKAKYAFMSWCWWWGSTSGCRRDLTAANFNSWIRHSSWLRSKWKGRRSDLSLKMSNNLCQQINHLWPQPSL